MICCSELMVAYLRRAVRNAMVTRTFYHKEVQLFKIIFGIGSLKVKRPMFEISCFRVQFAPR